MERKGRDDKEMHKQTALRSVSTVTVFLHFTAVVQSEALILHYINERDRWKRELKPLSNSTQTQLKLVTRSLSYLFLNDVIQLSTASDLLNFEY